MKRIFTFAIALLSMLATLQAANVVFDVVVPNDPAQPTTHLTNSCWIVGNFNNWNNNLNKLTKVDDTHYTITLDDSKWGKIKVGADSVLLTTANIEYKYLSGGGDWAYVEKLADGSEKHANRAYSGVNNWVDLADPTKTETSIGTNGKDTVVRWNLTWID